MKKYLLTLAAIAIAAIAAMAEEKTKTYNFGEINGIEAGMNYQIHVTKGKSDKITVVYDSMYEQYMNIRHAGNVLHLGIEELPRKLRSMNIKPIKVYLEMDFIREVELSGAASASFSGEFQARDLDIDLSGATKLHGLHINGETMSIDCSGASDLTISGNVTSEIEVDLSGAADMEFDGKCLELDCELSGACSLKGSVSCRTGSIECSGASRTNLTGNAETLSIDGSGACTIDTEGIAADMVHIRLSGACKARVTASGQIHHDIARSCKMTYFGDAELHNQNEDSNIVRGR